jgi:hypothetical protein
MQTQLKRGKSHKRSLKIRFTHRKLNILNQKDETVISQVQLRILKEAINVDKSPHHNPLPKKIIENKRTHIVDMTRKAKRILTRIKASKSQ